MRGGLPNLPSPQGPMFRERVSIAIKDLYQRIASIFTEADTRYARREHTHRGKQDTLTAGDNITIVREGGKTVISATGGGGGGCDCEEHWVVEPLENS